MSEMEAAQYACGIILCINHSVLHLPGLLPQMSHHDIVIKQMSSKRLIRPSVTTYWARPVGVLEAHQ